MPLINPWADSIGELAEQAAGSRTELGGFRTILTLLSYPALIMFIFEGVSSRWAREHGSFWLPPDVREKADENGRPLLLRKYVLLVAVVFILSGGHPWRIIESVSSLRSSSATIRFGLAGGVLLMLCKGLLVIGWRGVASGERDSPVLKGPLSFWLTVFIAGGFAEALWQAVCISALLKNDSGPILAALLTAIPFTAARLGGTPSRIIGRSENAGAEAIIGFVLGLIFIWSGSLFSLWIASMIYTVSDFCWIRWRYGKAQA